MTVRYSDPKPEDYNLPNDYTFAANSWGDSFYKRYEPMTFIDAKNQCEADGAILAYPRSDVENIFIANIIFEQFWIGINDIDREGKFVTIDGFEVSYTNWYNNEPNNVGNEDGVVINFATALGFWNDEKTYKEFRFVCHYRIEGK